MRKIFMMSLFSIGLYSLNVNSSDSSYFAYSTFDAKEKFQHGILLSCECKGKKGNSSKEHV